MERYTARQFKRALAQEQLLQRLDRGENFEDLCQELGLSLSRDYLPQLRRRYRRGGSSWEALIDHRHGRHYKVTPERRAWLREQKREVLCQKLRTQEKRIATAQRKVQEYTERLEALEQEAQQKQTENQAGVAALRQASRESTTPKQRERLLVRAERLAAKGQVQQVRLQERRRRLVAHRRT